MGLSAELRWLEHRDRLAADLGDAATVLVEIPGWEPVNLDEGLRWLRASYYEAFKVDHEIVRSGKQAVVRFRSWEAWDG
ncbi:hypothetical protein K9B35_07365 [Sphingomonas sp. R647]|uniref:hypothetical protein n=1 Tax=Sphingomonas sp. R647 TaxID=2875233 RepID=UPI001CD4ABC8|nr:hypothetical protein [Sphingomonas sp. R647]MCA1197780.1 hypothetical protein [Sphingomonas sp. R647]